MRDFAVRFFVFDGRDDRGDRIVPADRANADSLAHERTAAIGADQQRRAQCFAIRQRHGDAGRTALDRRHRLRLDHTDRFRSLHATIEREADVTRLDHEPERLIEVLHLGAIEVEMQQRRPALAGAARQAAVGDHDLLDRLRDLIEFVAKSERAPHPV